MNTRVVTVASQIGSHGEQVAILVAQELGFRCLDEEVLDRAAREAGVPLEFIGAAEHIPPLRERVLAALANNSGWNAASWYPTASPLVDPLHTSKGYRKLIDKVLQDVAREGHAVVIGHAGQRFLRGRWDAVRVLTVASPGVRLLRIREARSVSEAEAAEIMQRVDAERKTYFSHTYGEHWLSPALYDLCLNTDHLKPTEAVHLICEAARQR